MQTLSRSEREGEISTIPLAQVINRSFPSMSWIATFVDIFIMVSITVSFIAVGAGYKVTCKLNNIYLYFVSGWICEHI